MKKLDLVLPKKKGPFYLRKLNLSEALDYMSKVSGLGREAQILKLVQISLVTDDGKSVYTVQQKKKMELDIGGVRLTLLGIEAEKENDFAAFASLSESIEAAEKN